MQSAYPNLPENQRKVADVLLQRIREVPFLSVIELEDLSGTSKATVVRLAQSLGFSGYHELRERVREGAQSEISRCRDRFRCCRGKATRRRSRP